MVRKRRSDDGYDSSESDLQEDVVSASQLVMPIARYMMIIIGNE